MKAKSFFLVFLIVFLGLSLFHFEFVPSVKANPDSNMWQVGASSDDCQRRLVSSFFSITSLNYYCGDTSSTVYDYSSGARFTNLNIPQGSTINSAYLQLKAQSLSGTIPETFIQGENSDNAATFSTADDYDGRARTSTSVSWTPSAWVADTWYTSSDIKTVIQEIVDRGGWASGNALALFWKDANGYGGAQKRLNAYSYDAVPADAPKLEVTWTEEEGETSLNRYGSASLTFATNIQKAATFNRQGTATITFTTNGIANLVSAKTLNLFGSAILTFGTNILRAISFNRFGTAPLTFTPLGTYYQSIGNFLNFYGSAALTFATNIQKLITLTRYGTSTLTFTSEAIRQFLQYGILHLYGSAVLHFLVETTISGAVTTIQISIPSAGFAIIAIVVAFASLALILKMRQQVGED